MDDAPPGAPLELPRRNMVGPILIVLILFIAFAAVWVQQVTKLSLQPGNVFDLMGMLFSLFWIMGWSVGVLVLAALLVFLFFFGDSARVADGRLISVLNIGPFKMIGDYELARIRNLRAEADASGERAKVLFEYDGVGCGVGELMPLDIAERNVKMLRDAMAGVATAPAADPVPTPQPAAARFTPLTFVPPAEVGQRRLPLLTMLVLIAANLIPLIGVLLGGWTLAEVMVLFWAESAVIGFYTLLKIAVVAKWWAPLPGLFFTGHFGGFMSIHFLFIYLMFVRGFGAKGPDSGAFEALTHLFVPLWPALLALFLSHGISFAMNFIARREYESATVQRLMTAPYGRIVLMHLTLIFGGWVVALLHDPMPALVMLIVLKVVADLRGHYGERAVSAENE
jgi:hypothetical protein